MDEVVKLVANKANISEEQARTAVNVVLDVLKNRLPAPLAGQIDAALEGKGAAEGIAKGLSSMLGNKS